MSFRLFFFLLLIIYTLQEGLSLPRTCFFDPQLVKYTIEGDLDGISERLGQLVVRQQQNAAPCKNVWKRKYPSALQVSSSMRQLNSTIWYLELGASMNDRSSLKNWTCSALSSAINRNDTRMVHVLTTFSKYDVDMEAECMSTNSMYLALGSRNMYILQNVSRRSNLTSLVHSKFANSHPTLLGAAVIFRWIEALPFLINEMKQSVDDKDHFGESAICISVLVDNSKFTELLLKAGANLDQKCGKDGSETLIERAVVQWKVDTIILLLERGANPLLELATHNGACVLELIGAKGVREVLRIAFNNIKSFVAKDEAKTCFSRFVLEAIMADDSETMSLLLGSGISPNDLIAAPYSASVGKNTEEMELESSIFAFCVLLNSSELAELCMRHNASGGVLVNGRPLLQYSIQSINNSKLSALLLENGANPNVILDKHYTPLYTAISMNNSDTVARLMNHGTDPHFLEGELAYPVLHFAAKHSTSAVVDRLLAGWKSINSSEVNKLSNGYFPLHYAAMHNDTDIVKLLVKYGAEVNLKCQGQKGDSALHMAILLNNKDMLEVLVDEGGDFFGLANDMKETPFFLFQRSQLDRRLLVAIQAKIELIAREQQGRDEL